MEMKGVYKGARWHGIITSHNDLPRKRVIYKGAKRSNIQMSKSLYSMY